VCVHACKNILLLPNSRKNVMHLLNKTQVEKVQSSSLVEFLSVMS